MTRVVTLSCRRIFAPRGGFYQARLAVSGHRARHCSGTVLVIGDGSAI